MSVTRVQLVGNVSTGASFAGIVTATSFIGNVTGTATTTTNIPNLTGAITSVNTATTLGSFSSSNLATALTDETGSGSAVFATSPTLVTPSLGIATATSLNVSGIVTALSFRGYGALVGTASSTTTTFVVTVASKTSNHRHFGTGSGSAYFIDGIESPFLTLLPGKTYRFTQEDGTNSSHPILFYYQADKTTQYTTNVTTTGTPGSAGAYTEIVVTDTTPVVLHYQCSNHGYMGNAAQFSSSVVDTPYQITARSGINVTGVTTSSSGFVGTLTGTATTAQGLTGTPNITVGNIVGAALTLSGNLTVNGTQTIINTTNLEITDPLVGIGSGNTTDAQADGDGIQIYGATNKTLTYNDTKKGFETNVAWATTETRFISVAEKLTRIDGNTASLVYNGASSNIGLCTNPSGNITLAVTGIPTDSSFDNHSVSFGVMVNQTGTARTCTAVTLNGLSATIRWAGGSLSAAISGVTTTSGMDIFNFTGINTIGSASTTANYYLLGVVNGGFR
jgi:hypothetical protein